MNGQGSITKLITVSLGALFLVFGPPLLFTNGLLKSDQVAAIVLLGILSMLGVLLSFAMLMKLVGISDPTQALGMPEGSVRAMLALALIGLFAVLAAVVFEAPSLTLQSGLTVEQVEYFRKSNSSLDTRVIVVPERGEATFRIELPGTPRMVDEFTKTTMASIATLMTAIVAFYFGGRSVEIAQNRAPPPPVLTGVDPPEYSLAKGPLPLRLMGRYLNEISVVRLRSGTIQLPVGPPRSNDAEVQCEVRFDTIDDPTKLPLVFDIEAEDRSGRVTPLAGRFRLMK